MKETILDDTETLQLTKKLLMDLMGAIPPGHNPVLDDENYYNGETAFYWCGYISNKLDYIIARRCK